MAAKFKATVQMACWKEHVCMGCGSTFCYLLNKKRTGEGPTATLAESAARAAAMDSLKNDVEMQPCPTCGIYQPDMIGSSKAAGHGCLLVVIAILLFLVAFLATMVSTGTFVFPPLYVVTWLATAVCAGAAVGHAWLTLRNPNNDPEGNRRLAQPALEEKTLRLEKPGNQGQPLTDALPRTSGVGHWTALCLLFLGVAGVASPEIARLVLGWPMNPGCDPVVAGPGDDPTVYVPGEISSVKGLWRGRATADVLNAQELGMTDSRLSAKAKEDTWGRFIFGKRVKAESPRLWAHVTLPDSPDLAWKKVELRIHLDVDYPAEQARGFQDDSRTFEHTAELRLAAPFAGRYYSQLRTGGGVLGGALVLWMGYWLYRLTSRLKLQGLPSFIVPIDELPLPE